MFHEVLSNIMIKRNLSQKQIAALSGLTESSISRFLSGERLPGYQAIMNIAEGLNVSPGLLFNSKIQHDHVAGKIKHAAIFRYGIVVPDDFSEHSGSLSFNFYISENVIDGDVSSLYIDEDINHRFIFVKNGSVGFKMDNEKYKDISAGNMVEISGAERSAFIPAGTTFTYNLFSNKSDKLARFKNRFFGQLLK